MGDTKYTMPKNLEVTQKNVHDTFFDKTHSVTLVF